ncbi:alpha beta hydrolase fold protein [Drechmeria coniospora]|uniref:Alpha beta hydrolase fold protein n=1 Tax=Drechmeria coniospora TaxID=98403 RepID=A0A151GRP4_DRECN|nr:alpha beta hydrolase fold protein [Drechmeria coniospora]KYK59763.1 alpha beta hydrolase fold protein [Drechmeria coniospora]
MDITEVESFVPLRDGARLRVKLLGRDKTRPLLIALHGAQGVADHREPLSSFTFLSDQFRLLVFDARGSGKSDDKGPFTHQQWVSDVEELREWAGASTCLVAGGSYGGMVALEYALAYPRRVSALILRDTWANGVLGMMSCLKAVLTNPRIQPDAERQLRVWSGNTRDDDDLASGFAEIVPIYTPDPEKVASSSTDDAGRNPSAPPLKLDIHHATHNFCFTNNQPRFDLRTQLKNINVPTLVVCGRHDPITPVMFSEEIARLIPNAQLAIFEDSGHSPPADEPEAFQKTVRDFLGRCESEQSDDRGGWLETEACYYSLVTTK